MTVLDWLKATDILVGLMLTLFGVGSGAIVWAHLRIKKSVAEAGLQQNTALAVATTRLDEIEQDVKATAAELRELRGNVHGVESRLAGMERTVAGLPSREDIHTLIVSMTKLNGRMDTIEERLRPIGAFAERMQEWMLEQGK